MPAICGRDRLVEVGHLVAAPDLEHAVLPAAPRRSAAPARRGRDRGTRTRPRSPSPRRRAPRPRRRRCARPPPRLGRSSRRYSASELGGAARLGRALVPLDRQRLAALHRGPGVLRPRRRRRAGSAPRRPRPSPPWPPPASNDLTVGAEPRRVGHHRGQHAGQPDVDRERAACRWSSATQSSRRSVCVADQRPVRPGPSASTSAGTGMARGLGASSPKLALPAVGVRARRRSRRVISPAGTPRPRPRPRPASRAPSRRPCGSGPERVGDGGRAAGALHCAAQARLS